MAALWLQPQWLQQPCYPCLAYCLVFFGSLVPAMCDVTLCVQVHELPEQRYKYIYILYYVYYIHNNIYYMYILYIIYVYIKYISICYTYKVF